ncbi:Succinylornithine transaminase [Frankliniella fusca]|uniref:Succinylornithine transaminase n=1 Tax=Frankliniella fusca TaxID=407009 RepID=A0AAE1L8C7_9NEOP|nr:Succinylornithine transaminase [Frankliniella fusca]
MDRRCQDRAGPVGTVQKLHAKPMLIAIKHILYETGNADSFVTDDATLGIPLFPSAGHKSIVAKVDAFRTFTKTR